jgi:hypothetical protein
MALALSTFSLGYAGITPGIQLRTTTPVAEVPVRPDLTAPGDLWEALEDVPWTSNEVSDKAGLEALAKKLNPVFGYWGAYRSRKTSFSSPLCSPHYVVHISPLGSGISGQR